MDEYLMNRYNEQLIMLDDIKKKLYDNSNELFAEYIGMEKNSSEWVDVKNVLNLPTNTHNKFN